MSNLKLLSKVSLPQSHQAPEIYVQNWTNLAMPSRMRVDHRTLDSSYGRFTIEPLEQGYAVTLGHSLRKTLLASMDGSAIVAVKIDGVKKLTDKLAGVQGGLLNLLLNLKEIEVNHQEEGMIELDLTIASGGKMMANDLAANGEVKVRNPDKEIIQLEEKVGLQMKLFVNKGRGYVTAEENEKLKLPKGTLYLDSYHSPIREIRYEVENARVDQKTDYDRLIFEIWTSGTITPQDCLARAAWVLRKQLGLFIHFDENITPIPIHRQITDEPAPLSPYLYRPVSELELSVRSINCLQNAKIDFIGELVQRSENELLHMKNFGRKSLNEIKAILSQMNLSLGMEIEGFDPDNPPESNF
jgi:DNA-directed RNA polymerase subunit alpha